MRPRRTEEVATCLALCQQAGVPVVRGGNTGSGGGATPDQGAANVVLSLDRMNAVRGIDTIANTLVAEAGCILGNPPRGAGRRPAAAAEPGGRGLQPDRRQRRHQRRRRERGAHGMARELVLGLEAVLPTGEVFHGCARCARTTPATTSSSS